MNGETYSMQWMQRGMQRIKNSSSQQLIIDSQREAALLDVVESERIEQRMSSNDATHYLTNGTDDMQYIVASTVGDVDLSSATLEQMAAENLIFMARDGQMEILSTDDADGTVVVSASGNTSIDCAAVMQQIAKSMLADDGGTGADCGTSMGEEDHYNEDFTDSTPQMVTEEVITDDWVQSQGEDRVEISAEQIIGSNSQVLLDMEEVPLPTVQDEYSALRPFPCDFCSRRFRKKASLMNHMVAHQTDRSLLCKLCGLRFSHRSTLINHLKAHAEQDQDYDNEIMNFTNPSHSSLQTNVNSNYFHENDWPENINTENAEILQKDEVNSKSSPSKSGRSRMGRLKPKTIKNNNNSCENLSQNGQTVMQNIKIERDSETTNEQNVFPVLDDNKPFVCQNCGLAFARQKALLSHVKTHSNDSPYECPTCGDVFWDKGDLQEHQRVHTFEESNSEYEPEPEVDETHSEIESDNLYGDFYCSECGLCFHRQDLLRRHAKLHCKPSNNTNRNELEKPTPELEQNNNNHCCNTCGQTFSSALELLAHAEIHTRYPAFKCVLCGETFTEENAIKSHLQTNHAHEMTQNSCVLCGKECRDRRALIKHAWDHSREKCHTCSKCGKSFHNKARLKRHMASHRDKTVTCDVCHEEFPDGRTLSNHRHSHSTTSAGKLFPCNVCGKTFGSRSSQQIHVRIHTGERPYGCRYCWKAFADGGTLRKHERIHTGEKPYACSVCPRAFNQRVVLREHIRSHHSRIDVKRGTFFCSACSAELPSSAELLQHLIEHSDAITAMQRQPVTGPRKYKRRRKLKPHELAKFRSEGKNVSENTSEVDLSDFEMEHADDMVDMSGSSDATMQQNSMNNNKHKIEHNSLKTDNQSRRRSTRAGNKSIYTDIDTKSMNMQEDATPLDLDILDYMSDKKKRLDSNNSNCSEKLWPSSSSLLSNVENTLQTIETLVVSNKKSTDKKSVKPSSPKAGNRKQNLMALSNKKEERNAPTRARMIYTEKTTIETSSTKRRGKKSNPVITTNMVVSDYEIISPAAQPPAEISSNNVTIKQEARSEAGTLRADLFDAQLLLEASTLRKDQFEKFNPSIVNDLEEILRSPHKSGDQRRRFTSESSATQFLTEQSEEEQTHMIKIEPTSPDLRELISTPQSNTRSLRQTRELSINRKYLDFETPHQHHTRLRTPTKDSTSSYLVDFGTNTFDNPDVSPANSSTDVTAAATAAAAAAEAAVSSSSSLSPEQRKTRYFECEMCSSIFSDRAQLLDHVNIHI